MWLLDDFANVAAVVGLEAVLEASVGGSSCVGLVHNETVSHNYLCPLLPRPCSPEAETMTTHVHCSFSYLFIILWYVALPIFDKNWHELLKLTSML